MRATPSFEFGDWHLVIAGKADYGGSGGESGGFQETAAVRCGWDSLVQG
jgi:hypothetical protein